MNYVTAFARFWYDFIVGDDWTIAVAVIVTLVVLKLLSGTHIALWWLLPLVVIAALGASVMRATRSSS